MCLVAVAGCGERGDGDADVLERLETHFEKQVGVELALECPELGGDEPIECTGETSDGHPFTVDVVPDGDRWTRGEVRGLIAGPDAARQVRAHFQSTYDIELTSLHCPDLLTEGATVTCRAHADTLDFDIRATLRGSRVEHETDGLIEMKSVESRGATLFAERGATAVVDCGHPRGRVKRVGRSFSCSAVVDGQSAFLEVVITADGFTLTISGWQPPVPP